MIPMHYRTSQINFLDPPDAVLDALGARVERLETSELVVEDLLQSGSMTVALPAPPGA